MNHDTTLILLTALGTLYAAGMVWAFQWNRRGALIMRLIFTACPPLLLLYIWFMNKVIRP